MWLFFIWNILTSDLQYLMTAWMGEDWQPLPQILKRKHIFVLVYCTWGQFWALVVTLFISVNVCCYVTFTLLHLSVLFLVFKSYNSTIVVFVIALADLWTCGAASMLLQLKCHACLWYVLTLHGASEHVWKLSCFSDFCEDRLKLWS